MLGLRQGHSEYEVLQIKTNGKAKNLSVIFYPSLFSCLRKQTYRANRKVCISNTYGIYRTPSGVYRQDNKSIYRPTPIRYILLYAKFDMRSALDMAAAEKRPSGIYLSSLKYDRPKLAGGRFSLFLRRLIVISTRIVTRYGSICIRYWSLCFKF